MIANGVADFGDRRRWREGRRGSDSSLRRRRGRLRRRGDCGALRGRPWRRCRLNECRRSRHALRRRGGHRLLGCRIRPTCGDGDGQEGSEGSADRGRPPTGNGSMNHQVIVSGRGKRSQGLHFRARTCSTHGTQYGKSPVEGPRFERLTMSGFSRLPDCSCTPTAAQTSPPEPGLPVRDRTVDRDRSL